VRSGGFCRLNGVEIGGQRTIIGVGIGVLVVRRAARGFDALVGGSAGIACDVPMDTMTCSAILGDPYPHTQVVGMMGACDARGGDARRNQDV
jgi:hypothetical protein